MIVRNLLAAVALLVLLGTSPDAVLAQSDEFVSGQVTKIEKTK